jgi:hypothetical protein
MRLPSGYRPIRRTLQYYTRSAQPAYQDVVFTPPSGVIWEPIALDLGFTVTGANPGGRNPNITFVINANLYFVLYLPLSWIGNGTYGVNLHREVGSWSIVPHSGSMTITGPLPQLILMGPEASIFTFLGGVGTFTVTYADLYTWETMLQAAEPTPGAVPDLYVSTVG